MLTDRALADEDLDLADADEPVRRRTRKIRDEHRAAVAGWLAEDPALSGPEVVRRLWAEFDLSLSRSKAWSLLVAVRMAPLAEAVAMARGGDGAAEGPAWKTLATAGLRPARGPSVRPADPVLLVGSASWSEVGYGQAGRHDCPVCAGRDFDRERRMGLNRHCLRCQSATWDVHYHHPAVPRKPWVEGRGIPRSLSRRERRSMARQAGGSGR